MEQVRLAERDRGREMDGGWLCTLLIRLSVLACTSGSAMEFSAMVSSR